MNAIYKNLYQFTTYIPPMDFTIHEYLLASEPSILFATGTVQQATAILPEIQEILAGRSLKYIFVSHMESDECGGLSVFQQAYPDVQVICSGLTARELPGYGFACKTLAVSGGKSIMDGELDLRIFDYPSEVHLQNGIVCFEQNSGIFYSADLMLRYGSGGSQIIDRRWIEEVEAIDSARVPNREKASELKAALAGINPKFIAVGHGFCVECRS